MKNIFTKSISNSTIKKNYNPLKVNCKICKRRDGLYMNKTKDAENEVMEELNFIERIFFKRKFVEVYKKGVRKGFNWNNSIVR